MDCNDEQVRAIEQLVDRAFVEGLSVKGMFRPAMVHSLLTAAELIMAGHNYAGEALWPSVRALRSNVVSSLRSVFPEALRLASAKPADVPDDLAAPALGSLALGVAYNVLEDAFFSYWKGYANAVLDGTHLQFVPNGTALDARLRSFESSDGFSTSSRLDIDPLQTDRQLMKRFATCLMDSGHFSADGEFLYEVDDTVVAVLQGEYNRLLAGSIQDVLDVSLEHFRVRELVESWALLRALCA